MSDKSEIIVKKAGWVVFDWTNFYIVRRDYVNDFSLPKWHVEQWESLEETALREVLEETGLKCKILWEIWKVNYINPEWNVEVYFYAMLPVEKSENEIDTEVDEIIKWKFEVVYNKLTYETDKDILKRSCEFFNVEFNSDE